MKFIDLLVILCFLLIKSTISQQILDVSYPALDFNLYRDVLDTELCDRQLGIIENNYNLRAAYLDAGARIPKGILIGNLVDLGNYYQCLEINENEDNTVIEGKYCMINVPLVQDLNRSGMPSLAGSDLSWLAMNQTIREEALKGVEEYSRRKLALLRLLGEGDTSPRVALDSPLASQGMKLGVCIPKPCTTHVALDRLLTNFTSLGLKYDEEYCRLLNDKPWAPADYVFIVVTAVIFVLTVLSTSYDVYQTVHLKKDAKTISTVYRSFSMYTNTRRLVTYTPNPGNLECVDGIRAFAMMWVILGHTFSIQMSWFIANPIDAARWMTSAEALWVTAGTITVDTFFTLSGLLVVYTTAGKFTGWKLVKNLHLFYINRILRMFPILASAILLQASLFNWVSDGPFWSLMVAKVHRCRANWWLTLLYVQNYVKPVVLCLGPSWYLAIDMQCYVICPIILFWVLNGKKSQAWIALVGGLIAILAASTIYNFQMNFRSSGVSAREKSGPDNYYTSYYFNTLTRASPFSVGMVWGYAIHAYRRNKLKISPFINWLIWCCAAVIGGLIVYSHYPVMSGDWDNQLLDNLSNSFKRPVWAMVIGWMIFACACGHGGPINWILTLRVWKVPGRLSYAMYILHYSLIYVVQFSALSPTYFSINSTLFTFVGLFFLSMFVAFVLTVLVDAPFGILIKLAMGEGPKKKHPKKTDVEVNDASEENTNDNDRSTNSFKTTSL